MHTLDELLLEVQRQTGVEPQVARTYVESSGLPLGNIDAIREYLCRELGLVIRERDFSLSRLPSSIFEDGERQTSGHLVQLQGVGKSAGERLLFEDLDLTLSRGEKSLLIGRNGAGKSTLLRVIAGVDTDYDGKIARSENADVMLIDQDLCLAECDEMPLEEAITKLMGPKGEILAKNKHYESLAASEGIPEDELDHYLKCIDDMNERDLYFVENIREEILRHFGFELADMPREVSSLSGGERLRLAFAAALLRRPDLLLLDEPTNHLDIEGIVWLEQLLKLWKRAVICVSHDRSFIQHSFDTIVEVTPTGLRKYRTRYDEFLRLREHERAVAAQNRDQMRAKRQELESFIAQNRFDPMKGALVRRKRRELEDLELPEKEGMFSFEGCNFEVSPYHSSVLRVSDLAFGYGSKRLGEIERLELGPSDRLAVMGPNGAGKTTMIRTMVGHLPALRGEVVMPRNVRVGYLSQLLDTADEQSTLASVIDKATGRTIEEAMRYLSVIGLQFRDAQKKWGEFSGGEKVKVGIVLLILNSSQLLVLDEPTNHLDLKSKTNLVDILGRYNGSILVASHDRDFLTAVTTDAMVIDEGKVEKTTTQNAIRTLEKKWIG